jgi:hypothetical protein
LRHTRSDDVSTATKKMTNATIKLEVIAVPVFPRLTMR